jgi:hypothetical protein
MLTSTFQCEFWKQRVVKEERSNSIFQYKWATLNQNQQNKVLNANDHSLKMAEARLPHFSVGGNKNMVLVPMYAATPMPQPLPQQQMSQTVPLRRHNQLPPVQANKARTSE